MVERQRWFRKKPGSSATNPPSQSHARCIATGGEQFFLAIMIIPRAFLFPTGVGTKHKQCVVGIYCRPDEIVRDGAQLLKRDLVVTVHPQTVKR